MHEITVHVPGSEKFLCGGVVMSCLSRPWSTASPSAAARRAGQADMPRARAEPISGREIPLQLSRVLGMPANLKSEKLMKAPSHPRAALQGRRGLGAGAQGGNGPRERASSFLSGHSVLAFHGRGGRA